MTRDGTFHDLVQQEVDGANTEEESTALRALLERDAAARQELEQLRQVAATLERIEPLKPPSGLRRQILSQLGSSRGTTAGFSRRLFGTGPRGRIGFRYVYAVAAGVLLGAVGYHVVSGGFTPGKLNGDDLVGTIGLARPGATVPVNEWEFDVGGAFGTADVVPVPDGFEVRIAVDTPEPVDVTLEFDPERVGFLGFRQPLSGTSSVIVTEDGVRFVHPGRRPQAVRLAPRGKDPVWVELRLAREGQVLHEGPLELPGRVEHSGTD